MSDEPQTPDRTDVLFYVLRRRRAQARLVLLFERLWPALWPPIGLAGAFLCAALLDLPALLPPGLHAALLVVTVAAMLALLARGLYRIAMPDAGEADRRLERASGLRHRPLAVLADHPAARGAEALWKAHVARAQAQIGRLRVGIPRPGLAARDRRALRGGLIVALVACLVIAGEQTPARLARAVNPVFAPPATPSTTQLQAWITPPAFTGLAPLFLNAEGGAVSVPSGSHLTISLTGGSGVPSLTLDGRTAPFQTLDNASFQADQDLTSGGRLRVVRHGRQLGAWDLTVVADRAPEVSFPEPPGATRSTRQPQTRLPWQVSHEYGVVSLQAELKLRDRPDAPPLVVVIPLPGGSPKSAKGVRLQDLTAHPWAGLPVIARLVARDAPGLTGTSAEAGFNLPERRFQHPVARALMAVRKGLTLKPDDRVPAIDQLDRLAGLDEVWKDDLGAFLNLRAIAGLLYRDRSQSAVDEAQSRMWQLALHLEEGAPERTARALEQARQALREALDADKRGEKVDPAEIDRRMKDVQEALQRHLDALAEQARRDPGSQQFDPDSQRLDARDLQRLAEEAREAAREGRMDDARQKLAELDQMLQDLQNARPEHGQMTERQRQRAEKRQRGQQQMSALQDMVRRQGGLLDHAQQRADADRGGAADPRRPFPFPRQPWDPQQGAGQERPQTNERPTNERQTAERQGEQRVQQALRRALGELMQQYGDLTGQIPPNLGEADTAMREAMQALGQGQDPAAAGAQQRAIEALQKGGRGMSQQMARQFGRPGDNQGDDEGDDGDQDGQMAGNGQDGNQPGGQFGNQYGGDRYGAGRADRPWGRGRSMDRRADDRRDPLGRNLKEGTSGLDESGDVQVPDQMEEARTRAIQEELRRRGAERTRPQPELDYIDRLLRQF
ncbi:DUF4175 domain-containing protein [Limobrevibacterium gyesilva]|uniref:DUF4175 domain-containing protein n=1 Tax=Limobrevibacterium gyesilva TaxID=2991712 RepID=A0AA41YN68_9PROT|nr:DUF4175 domain-containing protein [Limobrevibacterium gyesilva]MCW3476976.1 DUF4175 domain-containing protein [Limobrevibacterium gyesilva]